MVISGQSWTRVEPDHRKGERCWREVEGARKPCEHHLGDRRTIGLRVGLGFSDLHKSVRLQKAHVSLPRCQGWETALGIGLKLKASQWAFIRRGVIFSAAVATLVFSIWQQMQALAIVALLTITASVYHRRASSILDHLQKQIPRLRSAKFGDVEFILDKLGEEGVSLLERIGEGDSIAGLPPAQQAAAKRLQEMRLIDKTGVRKSEFTVTDTGEIITEAINRLR